MKFFKPVINKFTINRNVSINGMAETPLFMNEGVIEKLTGSALFRKQIIDGTSEKEILESQEHGLSEYKVMRKNIYFILVVVYMSYRPFLFSLKIKKKTWAALNIFMSKNLLESFRVEKGYQKIL